MVTSSPLAMSTWALSTMLRSGSTFGVDESDYVVDDSENMENHLVLGDDDGDGGLRYFGLLRMVVMAILLLSFRVMMIMVTW